MKRETLDTSLLGDPSGRFKGDAKDGAPAYHQKLSCVGCHGRFGRKAPGSKADFDDFPGKASLKNPWEFVHKVRCGQPETQMPQLVAPASAKKLGDLGAYCQRCRRKPRPAEAEGCACFDTDWGLSVHLDDKGYHLQLTWPGRSRIPWVALLIMLIIIF